MSLDESKFPVIYLKSGEIYFTEEPVIVLTVLGSCVSVTLFHRSLGYSAICHGLLPRCRGRDGCSDGCTESARYVECSIKMMSRQFRHAGVRLRDLEARIFGGSDMFGATTLRGRRLSVGKENIETAIKTMEREGLQVSSMDVGGENGCKIYFNTLTGDVQLKRLPPRVILAGA
jgi:chemotaxis protein CheD